MLSLRDRSSLVAVFSALSLWIGAVERAMAVGVWAGRAHTVALKSNGSVWAWGDNSSGQLGLGSTGGSYLVPTEVIAAGTTVTDIAVGANHTLALRQDGTVLAWGLNNVGQSGCAVGGIKTPTAVALSGVAAISAGLYHSVVLMQDGTVKVWGHNTAGQWGVGTQTGFGCTPQSVLVDPSTSTTLQDVVAISAGDYHTLALKQDGTVWAWGGGSGTQLAYVTPPSSPPNVLSATAVPGLNNIAAISAGSGHNLVLDQSGNVWAWGKDSHGQLGNGMASGCVATPPTPAVCLTPVQVLTGATAVSTGGAFYSMALMLNGTVNTWGWGLYGQLGNSGTGNKDAPTSTSVPSPFTAPVVAIDASGTYDSAMAHSVAYLQDGTVYAWGSNGSGQLGIGSTTQQNSPALITVDASGNPFLLFSTHTVTPTAGANGTISLNTPQTVNHGDTTAFTITPDVGYDATVTGTAVGTGCDTGTLTVVGNVYTYTTGAITADCSVDATFTPIIYTVSATAGANGTVNPATQPVNYGSTTTVTITPDVGYTATVTGCNGSLDAAGTTYTTDVITADCTVDATFTPIAYAVSIGGGSGGGSFGSGTQNINYGTPTTVIVTPDPGYDAIVTGCNGTLSGNVYTIPAVMGACAVDVQFVLKTFTITASASGGGSVSPTTQVVNYGAKAYVTLMPNSGYTITTATGCNGTLSGQQYTTGTITNACTIQVTFAPPTKTYTVSALGSTGGIISPGSKIVTQGAITTFSVTPNTGYTATVTGCGGTLSGNTYVTAAINSACTVSASFKQSTYSIVAMAIGNGRISPTRTTTTHGSRVTFSVTPYSGYRISTVTGCGGGVLTTNSYIAGPITSACTVYANFVKK